MIVDRDTINDVKKSISKLIEMCEVNETVDWLENSPENEFKNLKSELKKVEEKL
jgi:hypothetical protein